MFKKRVPLRHVSIVVLFLALHTFCHSNTVAPWNFFIYMETNEDLSSAAFKNINQLAQAGTGKANVFVLLHAYDEEVWVYRIKENVVKQLWSIPWKPSAADTIIDSIKILEHNFPAKHHCFVLWNHGYGILEPHFNEEIQEWELEPDGENNNECSIKRSKGCDGHKVKGMMVNSAHQTCMGNAEMIRLFDCLCNDVLNGKKIDICGLDVCKGAMFEHAYQVRDYVHYLLGAQECELVDGWPYELIMQAIVHNPEITPHELAKTIISAYREYYDERAPRGIYTHSAVCVDYLDDLKLVIDDVAQKLIAFFDVHDADLISCINSARYVCRRFCDAPMYVDLYSFFFNVDQKLQVYAHREDVQSVQATLKEGCRLVRNFVVANATGSHIAHEANGISLYYPFYTIDSSYLTAPFAQESCWLSFLQKVTGS